MGKALIIKGANFSAESVKVVEVGNPVELLATHIDSVTISQTTGVIVSLSGWEVMYVPITSGSTYRLTMEWSNPHLFRVGTSSTTPELGTAISLLIDDTTAIYPSGRKTLDYIYTATADGFLAWQNHKADSDVCKIVENGGL